VFRAAALATAIFAVAVIPASAAPGPVATAAATCKTPTDDSWGPTYVLQLTVRRTTCRTGKAVVQAYHRCRLANGGKKNGTCKRRVLRFRCTERRLATSRTQFDAKVTCSRRAARIAYTYTQYT